MSKILLARRRELHQGWKACQRALFLLAFLPFLQNCSGGNDSGINSAPADSGIDSAPALTWSLLDSTAFKRLSNQQEGIAIGSPEVTANPIGDTLVMVYAQGGSDTKGRIGMAISSDGLDWTRRGSTGTILEPSTSGWDSHFLDTPYLLHHNGVWYLWYFGIPSNSTPGGAIGLATSTDGINFTRAQTGPVLQPGSPSDWDGLLVESPTVQYANNQFVMYYTGVSSAWLPQVGRATSLDGIHWTKEPAKPVLTPGIAGAWDSYAAAVSSVTFRNGIWSMAFAGVSTANVSLTERLPQIGSATSIDGIRWNREIKNPILSTTLTGNLPNGPYNPGLFYWRGNYYVVFESGLGFGIAKGAF